MDKPTDYQLSRIYWGSVAGHAAEPVRIEWRNGELIGFTLGCGDPFILNEADCPLKILGNSAKIRPDAHNFLSNAFALSGQPTVAEEFGGPPCKPVKNVKSLINHGWRGPLA